MKKITKTIEQLRSGKAAGVDRIPPKLWKEEEPALHSKLHELLVYCWEQGKLPSELHDTIIITLYKNKGEKSDCSNYRGITLLSITGKILAHVLLNRLVPSIAEYHLPETQCGFRANRSTTDMVFILRQPQVRLNSNLFGSFSIINTETACPHKNTWAAVSWPPLCWQRCSCCPHQKSPAAPNFLLCRGYPALRTWGQLQEDWGLSPACTPRRVLPSSHHHRWNWAESSSSVHLSGVCPHIRCQDQQGGGQQTLQGSVEQWATGIDIYQAIMLNTPLYGSESWVTYRHHLWLLV